MKKAVGIEYGYRGSEGGYFLLGRAGDEISFVPAKPSDRINEVLNNAFAKSASGELSATAIARTIRGLSRKTVKNPRTQKKKRFVVRQGRVLRGNQLWEVVDNDINSVVAESYDEIEARNIAKRMSAKSHSAMRISLGPPRSKNPRMQNMFVIHATRGKTALKYIGGNRFSSEGRAVLFPSRAAATYEARELKSKYSQALRGYTLRIHS